MPIFVSIHIEKDLRSSSNEWVSSIAFDCENTRKEWNNFVDNTTMLTSKARSPTLVIVKSLRFNGSIPLSVFDCSLSKSCFERFNMMFHSEGWIKEQLSLRVSAPPILLTKNQLFVSDGHISPSRFLSQPVCFHSLSSIFIDVGNPFTWDALPIILSRAFVVLHNSSKITLKSFVSCVHLVSNEHHLNETIDVPIFIMRCFIAEPPLPKKINDLELILNKTHFNEANKMFEPKPHLSISSHANTASHLEFQPFTALKNEKLECFTNDENSSWTFPAETNLKEDYIKSPIKKGMEMDAKVNANEPFAIDEVLNSLGTFKTALLSTEQHKTIDWDAVDEQKDLSLFASDDETPCNIISDRININIPSENKKMKEVTYEMISDGIIEEYARTFVNLGNVSRDERRLPATYKCTTPDVTYSLKSMVGRNVLGIYAPPCNLSNKPDSTPFCVLHLVHFRFVSDLRNVHHEIPSLLRGAPRSSNLRNRSSRYKSEKDTYLIEKLNEIMYGPLNGRFLRYPICENLSTTPANRMRIGALLTKPLPKNIQIPFREPRPDTDASTTALVNNIGLISVESTPLEVQTKEDLLLLYTTSLKLSQITTDFSSPVNNLPDGWAFSPPPLTSKKPFVVEDVLKCFPLMTLIKEVEVVGSEYKSCNFLNSPDKTTKKNHLKVDIDWRMIRCISEFGIRRANLLAAASCTCQIHIDNPDQTCSPRVLTAEEIMANPNICSSCDKYARTSLYRSFDNLGRDQIASTLNVPYVEHVRTTRLARQWLDISFENGHAPFLFNSNIDSSDFKRVKRERVDYDHTKYLERIEQIKPPKIQGSEYIAYIPLDWPGGHSNRKSWIEEINNKNRFNRQSLRTKLLVDGLLIASQRMASYRLFGSLPDICRGSGKLCAIPEFAMRLLRNNTLSSFKDKIRSAEMDLSDAAYNIRNVNNELLMNAVSTVSCKVLGSSLCFYPDTNPFAIQMSLFPIACQFCPWVPDLMRCVHVGLIQGWNYIDNPRLLYCSKNNEGEKNITTKINVGSTDSNSSSMNTNTNKHTIMINDDDNNNQSRSSTNTESQLSHLSCVLGLIDATIRTLWISSCLSNESVKGDVESLIGGATFQSLEFIGDSIFKLVTIIVGAYSSVVQQDQGSSNTSPTDAASASVKLDDLHHNAYVSKQETNGKSPSAEGVLTKWKSILTSNASFKSILENILTNLGSTLLTFKSGINVSNIYNEFEKRDTQQKKTTADELEAFIGCVFLTECAEELKNRFSCISKMQIEDNNVLQEHISTFDQFLFELKEDLIESGLDWRILIRSIVLKEELLLSLSAPWSRNKVKTNECIISGDFFPILSSGLFNTCATLDKFGISEALGLGKTYDILVNSSQILFSNSNSKFNSTFSISKDSSAFLHAHNIRNLLFHPPNDICSESNINSDEKSSSHSLSKSFRGLSISHNLLHFEFSLPMHLRSSFASALEVANASGMEKSKFKSISTQTNNLSNLSPPSSAPGSPLLPQSNLTSDLWELIGDAFRDLAIFLTVAATSANSTQRQDPNVRCFGREKINSENDVKFKDLRPVFGMQIDWKLKSGLLAPRVGADVFSAVKSKYGCAEYGRSVFEHMSAVHKHWRALNSSNINNGNNKHSESWPISVHSLDSFLSTKQCDDLVENAFGFLGITLGLDMCCELMLAFAERVGDLRGSQMRWGSVPTFKLESRIGKDFNTSERYHSEETM